MIDFDLVARRASTASARASSASARRDTARARGGSDARRAGCPSTGACRGGDPCRADGGARASCRHWTGRCTSRRALRAIALEERFSHHIANRRARAAAGARAVLPWLAVGRVLFGLVGRIFVMAWFCDGPAGRRLVRITTHNREHAECCEPNYPKRASFHGHPSVAFLSVDISKPCVGRKHQDGVI